MIYLAILIYIAALIVANLLVSRYGPSISPVLAFIFIGLDLTMRDWLNLRMRAWQMGTLIAMTGLLTYLISPASSRIAAASAVSFAVAALVDWAIFTRIGGAWIWRAHISNFGSAAVDSLLFPTLAWGSLMLDVVALQFIAKVYGGSLWALAFAYYLDRQAAETMQPRRTEP